MVPSSKFSYLYGAVFSNISAAEARSLGLPELLGRDPFALWRDDIDGADVSSVVYRRVDEIFEARFWKSRRFDGKFADRLWRSIDPTSPRRGPETRRLPIVPSTTQTLAQKDEPQSPSTAAIRPNGPESLVARVVGGHHRVNGVVGSGKTLFIVEKCLDVLRRLTADRNQLSLITELPRILVLTFTVSGASKVQKVLAEKARTLTSDDEKKILGAVEIVHGAGFLRRYQLGERNEPSPASLSGDNLPALYDAVFFDEFQDAPAGWGRLLSRLVRDPAESPLVVTFDPAQGAGFPQAVSRFKEITETLSLRDGKARDDLWQSRNHYLDVSYRVPSHIGDLAVSVHSALANQTFDTGKDKGEERLARVIDRALRPTFSSPGGTVTFHPVAAGVGDQDEALTLAEVLTDVTADSDVGWGDVSILMRPEKEGAEHDFARTAKYLEDLDIPIFRLAWGKDGDGRGRFHERGDKVTLATPVRMKGLEIPIVVMSPGLVQHLAAARRPDQFYIGATRATSRLLILGAGHAFDVAQGVWERMSRA
jgi:hypothetical protein